MKWKKLGKIFDPLDHLLSDSCKEFAQSPQTLVFDNFVRIYFSTRKKDGEKNYISYISYVDYDKSFKKILNISSKTVLELGKLGTFDEHGIFPINPLKIKNHLVAYTCGWSRRISVPVETSIGYVYSEDHGETFKRLDDGPILTASSLEPFLVGDPFVKIFNDQYYMWYIWGKDWVELDDPTPSRVYKIGMATSQDGLSWEKNHIPLIKDKLNPHECQALPTVIKIKNRYHMLFCYREANNFRANRLRSYKMGYAYSDDLKVWHRDDSLAGIETSEDSWDSDMLCYPHLFEVGDHFYLLYNGNEFGRRGFGLAILENEN
jgi:hypothetical protein